jgi:hypothetical protein
MNRSARELVLMIAATAAALAAQADGTKTEPNNGPKTLAEAWRAGLQRMRDQHAPGLVFVLPPADRPADAKVQERLGEWPRIKGGEPPTSPKTAREQLLWLLQRWRANDLAAKGEPARALPDLSVVFGLAVPIVAEAATCDARDGETLLLLAPDGARKEGFAIDLADANAVADALTPDLLSERAVAARRAAVPAAAQQLADKVQQLPVWPRQPVPTQQETLRAASARVHELAAALVQVADARVVATPGLHMVMDDMAPLGTELGATWDPCPPCGMAAVALPFHSLLKLLPK